MNRPYIFCHMMTSLDGKIMGNSGMKQPLSYQVVEVKAPEGYILDERSKTLPSTGKMEKRKSLPSAWNSPMNQTVMKKEKR